MDSSTAKSEKIFIFQFGGNKELTVTSAGVSALFDLYAGSVSTLLRLPHSENSYFIDFIKNGGRSANHLE